MRKKISGFLTQTIGLASILVFFAIIFGIIMFEPKTSHRGLLMIGLAYIPIFISGTVFYGLHAFLKQEKKESCGNTESKKEVLYFVISFTVFVLTIIYYANLTGFPY